jgi:hypothetical protein
MRPNPGLPPCTMRGTPVAPAAPIERSPTGTGLTMRKNSVWMVAAAAAAFVLAGCPGEPGAADDTPGATEEAAARPGMDFEVTYDTQFIGGREAPNPETAPPDPES